MRPPASVKTNGGASLAARRRAGTSTTAAPGNRLARLVAHLDADAGGPGPALGDRHARDRERGTAQTTIDRFALTALPGPRFIAPSALGRRVRYISLRPDQVSSTAHTLTSTRPLASASSPHHVLRDVGGDAGRLLRPRDPQRSRPGSEPSRKHRQVARELPLRVEEGLDEIDRRTQRRAHDDAFGQRTEEIEVVGGRAAQVSSWCRASGRASRPGGGANSRQARSGSLAARSQASPRLFSGEISRMIVSASTSTVPCSSRNRVSTKFIRLRRRMRKLSIRNLGPSTGSR